MSTVDLRAEARLQPGYQFGHYSLIELIGRGGQASIWSAWDSQREQIVAVRLVPYRASDQLQVFSQLDQEAHLVASLTHPNVLPLYEFGSSQDLHYFAYRYISSGSLQDRVEEGALPVKRALSYVVQIASALDYIHERGVVHRDIKPANLLVDAVDRVYLSDFGLAKDIPDVTVPLHTGRGTAPYAPPEQHLRQSVTPLSDIYSLGVLIYELLTGRLPFGGSASLALLQINGPQNIPDPRQVEASLPAGLARALRKLTAAEVAARPRTAREALDLVLAAFAESGARFDPEDLLPRGPRLSEKEQDAIEARVLLEHSLQELDPLGEKFFIPLTHFVLIDRVYAQAEKHGLYIDEPRAKVILRAALAHNYHFDLWWRRLSDLTDARAAVSEAVLHSANTHEIDRVLAELAGAQPGSIHLSPSGVNDLIRLAFEASSRRVRDDAFMAVTHLVAPAPGWVPVAISENADDTLARAALSEEALARQAAELIGRLGSTRALRHLLEAYKQGEKAAWRAILRARQNAGILPAEVPVGLRLRIGAARAGGFILQEQRVLVWVRALLGLLAGGLIALLLWQGVMLPQELQARDALLQPFPTSGIVSIVAIDDASLSRYGRWENWSRSLHAELIHELREAGASVIAFDVTFASPTEDDDLLAEAMRDAGNVIQPVLGQGDAFATTPGAATYLSAIEPQQVLRDASLGVGHTNVLHDSDGTVRRLPVVAKIGEQQYLALPLAAVQAYISGTVDLPEAAAEPGVLHISGREIPIGTLGDMLIHYAGPPAEPAHSSFQIISFQDVLEGNFDLENIRGKIVLVGVMATAQPDVYLTPVSLRGRPMFGVEILANSIETIWSGRFIRQLPMEMQIAIVIVLGLLTALLMNVRPWAGLMLAVALILLYSLLAIIIFDSRGLVIGLLYPLLSIGLSYVLVTAYRFSMEIRQRRRVIQLLEARVNPQVAQATLRAVERGEINLGGQVQEITVLVADLRNLAAFSSAQSPEEVMAAANTYVRHITGSVLAFDGTLAQQEGDRVMAIFNAPLNQPDHPLRAIRVAMEIQQTILAYRQALPDNHPHHIISFSCGIYTGRAIVGHAGSTDRLDYTAIGDPVDLASHIASAANPGQILLGASTYEQVLNVIRARALPALTIRGRVAPVQMYQLLEVQA